jgi:hypothetical protein
MLTALMVAFNPYKLVLGPVSIIILAVALMVLLKFPGLKGRVSVLLVVAGFLEMVFPPWSSITFPWGFAVALATLIIGAVLGLFALITESALTGVLPKQPLTPKTRRLLRKALFSVAIIAFLASAVLISARATNLIREDSVVNFQGEVITNLKINGTISSVAINHEVGNGYTYHVFPAYITLKITNIIWSYNSSDTPIYSLPQGQLVIYCEKTDYPTLVVGQKVEVNGYYRPWMEDILYSDMLLISSSVNGSYLKAL